MAWRPRETAGVFHSPADAEEMCRCHMVSTNKIPSSPARVSR